jgi:Fe2+ or Zn2+ uptake regulation protein
MVAMVNEIVCNKCGKKFDMWDSYENYSINAHLGYGTKYDGDNLELHICCDCMEKLIDECIISPIKENT